MTTGGASIMAIAGAVPAARSQDELWDSFFSRHFSQAHWAERIYRSAGVKWRHPSVDPTVEDVSAWTTAARLRRYLPEAMPLAKGAATRALALSGIAMTDIGLLAVVSCTGYATPGLDVALARDLGLANSAERVLFGHMGCHAALPALGLASAFVSTRQRSALLLCVELPSLHIQAPSSDLDQILAHALFSDAAAAIAVVPGASPGGLSVVDIEARTDLSSADHITWEITDNGFRMGLSRHVPEVIEAHVGPTVDALLSRNGLGRADIAAWVAHPGGLGVLDAVTRALRLPSAALDVSRDVLEQYGNCSSATVLVVLEQLQRQQPVGAGGHIVLLAFGPGLTLYAVLLRANGV
jgi:alkylresorcinol/alkylpyrone synthase